jgi:hypothetical protein
MRRTGFFVTSHEHFFFFFSYGSCGVAVKLFSFLLSPYSLTRTCNNCRTCTFRDFTGRFYSTLLLQRGCKVSLVVAFIIQPVGTLFAYYTQYISTEIWPCWNTPSVLSVHDRTAITNCSEIKTFDWLYFL